LIRRINTARLLFATVAGEAGLVQFYHLVELSAT
jgi:hypothetical protein